MLREGEEENNVCDFIIIFSDRRDSGGRALAARPLTRRSPVSIAPPSYPSLCASSRAIVRNALVALSCARSCVHRLVVDTIAVISNPSIAIYSVVATAKDTGRQTLARADAGARVETGRMLGTNASGGTHGCRKLWDCRRVVPVIAKGGPALNQVLAAEPATRDRGAVAETGEGAGRRFLDVGDDGGRGPESGPERSQGENKEKFGLHVGVVGPRVAERINEVWSVSSKRERV